MIYNVQSEASVYKHKLLDLLHACDQTITQNHKICEYLSYIHCYKPTSNRFQTNQFWPFGAMHFFLPVFCESSVSLLIVTRVYLKQASMINRKRLEKEFGFCHHRDTYFQRTNIMPDTSRPVYTQSQREKRRKYIRNS